MKRALITGITGMDGSHMADLLLEKGYVVYGLERRKSVPNHANIEHLQDRITLLRGDLTDFNSLRVAIEKAQPDEIYNFASQAFEGESWTAAEMTINVNALGVLRLLEAVRLVNKTTRVWQASASAMFGNKEDGIKNEQSPLYACSPYSIAKATAHNLIRSYRTEYGMYACASICFAHEGERRGFDFVTRKISSNVAKISLGLSKGFTLGNLDSQRDWSYAPDLCVAMQAMMQLNTPEDFVLASGEAHSIRDFVVEAFRCVGINDWENYVGFDQTQIRKSDISAMTGDTSKAKKILGWSPSTTFEELVHKMVNTDLLILQDK
jgi:GDPmannose 4,6-dehydratase